MRQATIAGPSNTRTFPASSVKTYLASSTIVTCSTTKRMVHFCKPPNRMRTSAWIADESKALLALCLCFRSNKRGKWEDRNKQGAMNFQRGKQSCLKSSSSEQKSACTFLPMWVRE